MKIALIPLNPTIGDVAGNLAKIKDGLKAAIAADCRLAVFPELALIGYPPRDLLHYEALFKRQTEALGVLRKLSKDILILVGGISRNRAGGKPFHNTAYLLQNGQRAEYHKQLLPEYDIFDERRYFEPGTKPFTFRIGPLKFGVTICEDIWFSSAEVGRSYTRDPLIAYERAKVDFLINLSASPFEMGKADVRVKVLKHASRTTREGILYVNQFGGNDDLIFDGGALYLRKNGNALMQGPEFSNTPCFFDTEQHRLTPQAKPLGELAVLEQALVTGIRDYVRKTGHRQVVLGLSGGIDSAVVAALATQALGAENVLGVLMPSRYSSPESVTDALALAKNLGIATQTIPIDTLHRSFEAVFDQSFGAGQTQDHTAQNVQARIRGTLLMAISNNTDRLLLNTTNKSEMAVGYGTLYGDLCGALAVISDVSKTLVYELTGQINSRFEIIPKSIIIKAPSAELKPGQQDSDTLPSYDELDEMVGSVIEDEQLTLNPDNVTPEVLRMIFNSEYKRRQAPPGLKVTTKAFGSGRRLPIASRLDVTGLLK
jgi:NAD+ synthase (glutamine-hydrolysing)